MNVAKGASGAAGSFNDGNRVARFADGAQAAAFSDGGSLFAYLVNTGGGYGAHIGDGTRRLYLADGTYAINAINGGINANATTGFLVAGVPGTDQFAVPLTIADTNGVTHILYLRKGILCAA